MRDNRWNLKKRMLVGFLAVLGGVFVIITVLFLHTRNTLKEEYRAMLKARVEGIGNDIDALIRDVYNVSDNFAFNDQLESYIDKVYKPEDWAIKKADTLKLYKQIFSVYDMLQERQKLGAIYTYKGILFNFIDVNNDGQEVIDKLEEMGVNKKEHLMRFYWYPLQDNFFASDAYGDIRKDKIVMGVRNVYSVWKGFYVCTHIFSLREEELYNLYKDDIPSVKGDIFVLMGEGELLSSSDTEALGKEQIDPELRSMIRSREADEFRWNNNQVCVRQSEVNNWLTVAVIPEKVMTQEIDTLYLRIFLALGACMALCCAMILYLYRSLIGPVNELSTAMTEVYGGNLNAYVKVTARNEIGDMMRYYNDMLKSINVHVVEKLEADRNKKELELEVLMSQINPHFLYNTLENIVWKSNEAGRPDIGRLAASLGRMYRLSISGGKVIVPMQHEIEHLMAYIKIQKDRHGENFEFDLRIDAAKARQLYSLKILLQPVVENSFLYAAEGLERKLIIRLCMRERGEEIEIRVIDNGVGMGRERLAQVRDQIRNGRKHQQEDEKNRRSTGIGLNSVAARLTLYFGIQNPIKIYSKKGMGTITVIRMPRLTGDMVGEDGELKKP
ncbi:sensor histidine kinase [Murimonas intestini]|uniref:histidine kinase n=1 Tax=Murimonas intestini TaxID=1337051 RepID=A0AB73T362_9FIRM|nr:histidine kinase [Murimonas intestini]MCR1841513.1 histidine kinase [Murimonas intestini]MCR1867019.1 histidine kinase [Murimonas intestini]MCR1884042.1 histidine kinase [Murimonas intestini]